MEYIIIMIIVLVSLIIIKIGLDIKIKDIQEMKENSKDKSLSKITNKMPENKQICLEILNILDNQNVTIEECKESQTCLYMVMQNKILIGNIKDNFARIQTIAHECIHSVQNKKILKFNFILSHFNILYFIISCLLIAFKIVNKEITNILLIGLIISQFIFYIVRSFLETDAMIRAEYVSKEYIDKNIELLQEEKQLINNKYKQINRKGIKLYNFIIAFKVIIKVLILCLIILI